MTGRKTAPFHRYSLTLPVFLLCGLHLLLSSCSQLTASEEWVSVDRVIDGDTLLLEDDRRVRLLGLDAPEMGRGGGSPECFAPEATAYLTLLISETEGRIRLETDKRRLDVYGRVLAYLWNRQGEMLNEKILREGYALFVPESDAIRWNDRLRQAGEEARRSLRGLWHPDACP